MASSFKSSMVGKVHPTSGNSHVEPMHPNTSDEGYWYLSLPPHLYKHFVTLYFFDGTHAGSKYGIPMDPTAGTVTVEVSDNGVTYGPVANGSIDLSKPFQQPNFQGHAQSIRVNLNNVTPHAPEGGIALEATTVSVVVNSYN